MNLCVNGHDKDVVGTTTRAAGRGRIAVRCNQCVKEQRDREKAQRKAWRQANPKIRSKMSDEERLQKRRAREAARRARQGMKVRPRHLDGWEDEFGPCPKPEPIHTWLDWVAVQRMLAGIPIGRYPTRAEWDEFFARNTSTTQNEVAHAAGVVQERVWFHSKRNGYIWPEHLINRGGTGKEW